MPNEHDVFGGLSRAFLGPWVLRRTLDLRLPHRMVVFSDQHKGSGGPNDEFERCRPAYLAALAHYEAAGFTLVLLGDGEELWEDRWAEIARARADVLEAEARFGPERYLRVWGNHVDDWMEPALVRQRLQPRFLPTDRVWEGVRFRVLGPAGSLGELFLVHGHQGTRASDKNRKYSRWVLRTLWRPLQRLLPFLTADTPSGNPCLRGEHDRQMYAWASSQTKLILIAGHTHRPVWSSRTHLQRLEQELAALRSVPPALQDADYRALLAAKEAAVADRTAKYPPCGDSAKQHPAYFNSGCCKFPDGDITGIELEQGELRLVRWPAGGAAPREVLESGALDQLFGLLP